MDRGTQYRSIHLNSGRVRRRRVYGIGTYLFGWRIDDTNSCVRAANVPSIQTVSLVRRKIPFPSAQIHRSGK